MLGLVIASEPVDAGFNKDEAEFRVLVFAVGLEVFADCNSLFYEVPEVFWDVGGKALSFENTEDFVACHETDLGDAVRVTKGDTDLGWSEALSSKLCDVLDDVLWRCLEP